MSTLNPYLKQYKKNQIETATPEQILILLYDGAINFLNKAKVCLEDNSDDDFHKNMLRCKNIIAEFMESLDLEQGGEWALSLYNLYKYMRKLILRADGTKDVEKIDEVLKHLTSLRDTWQRAIEIASEERKQQAISNVQPSGSQSNQYGDMYETAETSASNETTTYTYDDSYENDDEQDDEEEDDDEYEEV